MVHCVAFCCSIAIVAERGYLKFAETTAEDGGTGLPPEPSS